MEPLFQLAMEIEKYQRLEAERQKIIRQIVELEIEASRTYNKE